MSTLHALAVKVSKIAIAMAFAVRISHVFDVRWKLEHS